ncbi:MAG: 5'/3'-nucleotidase SurE [Deltaproteobacteria bacterium]|jgi:5'-nucleotidase|nr:5'/3'-nucleotidase SurE [Deltaproteobacteria bacterium]
MRILLVNDDGIKADGLNWAYRALTEAGHRVLACAPDRERSAQSQSISLYSALLATPTPMPDGATGYAVSGTPADCVRLGCTTLAADPVEMVVSGINNDSNLGYDANYSGTVGAALEAAAIGYPALAVSLGRSENYDWAGAAAAACEAVAQFAGWLIPPGVLVNLNIPPVVTNPDWVWTPLNHIAITEKYVLGRDEEGRTTYKRTRLDEVSRIVEGSDIDLFLSGRVTLSPVGPVRTERQTFSRLVNGAPAPWENLRAQKPL